VRVILTCLDFGELEGAKNTAWLLASGRVLDSVEQGFPMSTTPAKDCFTQEGLSDFDTVDEDLEAQSRAIHGLRRLNCKPDRKFFQYVRLDILGNHIGSRLAIKIVIIVLSKSLLINTDHN
jgi:hypothetical protein